MICSIVVTHASWPFAQFVVIADLLWICSNLWTFNYSRPLVDTSSTARRRQFFDVVGILWRRCRQPRTIN